MRDDDVGLVESWGHVGDPIHWVFVLDVQAIGDRFKNDIDLSGDRRVPPVAPQKSQPGSTTLASITAARAGSSTHCWYTKPSREY